MSRLTNVIRRYTSIAAVIDILKRRELSLLNPESWDDRNDRYFMQLYKETKSIGGLYGLCAAQCTETYHHWKVFTGAADGACIEIWREPLEAILAGLDNVRYGNVEYLPLGKVDKLTPANAGSLPFYKRAGFTDEDEFRIIAETSEPQAPVIRIDFPLALIGRIELNPWLPATVAASLQSVLAAINPDVEIDIRRSHLIDSGRWKSAGDRVAGKKTPRTFKVKKKPRTPRPVR
jgi:hypothetical protein